MRRLIFLAPLALLWVFAGAVPYASAYDAYSSGGSRGARTGNCAACHGDFFVPSYTSQKDGTAWGTNLMAGHLNFIDTGCATCHGTARNPTFLGLSPGGSVGGVNLDPISCLGCHGRAEDAVGPAGCVIGNTARIDPANCGAGVGLRQHHANAGVGVCAGCHAGDPPVAVAESVNPPYYGVGILPTDACNDPPGSEAKFGPTGLDNDGDLLDDGADSDCVAAFPDIAVAPASLSFGVVFVGETSPAQTVTIRNEGTADLQVTGLTLTGSPDFDLVTPPPTPFTIAPGGSQSVSVTYTPSGIGADSGALEIASDDPDEPTVTVALSGSGEMAPMADINLNPPALIFGTLTVGDTATLTSQIENAGTADLTVTDIAPAAGTSAEFSFTAPATPFTIPVGGSQAVSVTYAPADEGADTGALDIASDDPDEPSVQLRLSGAGVAPLVCDIDVNPLLLDFGSIVEGTSSTLNTSVGNTGTADCTVDSLVVAGDPEFALGGGAPSTPFDVAPGAAVAVPVTYSPPAAGTHAGTLSIASNDADEALVVVELAGVATPTPQPDINLDPLALDFGLVTVGLSSTLTSRVENLGTAPLVVSAVNLCAGTSTEFSFAPLASLTIPAGSAETLSVTYTPADSGTDTGCIAIASNDPDEATVELGLSGSGEVLVPDISLAPTSLDFGVVLVGDTATLTSQIQNLGNADLTVTDIMPAAGTSGEFSFTAPAPPFVIPPGGSLAVSVTYAPVDAGVDTGSLEIASNDPDEPVVALGLTGTGEVVNLVPDIALVPTELAFGNVVIGNMRTLSAEIRNLGNADLEVSFVDLCAGTSAEYSFAPSAPLAVPPGGVQALSVTYAPVDLGADPGCIAIDSNDPDEPIVELGLSGAGVDQPPMAEVMIKVPGAINPKSRGVTPVRFWTEMMDLGIAMVTCGPAMAEPKRLNVEDFNDDGYDDVVGLFATRDLGVACGDELLVCQGMLADGTSFTGTSTEFKVVGPECKPSNRLAKRGR